MNSTTAEQIRRMATRGSSFKLLLLLFLLHGHSVLPAADILAVTRSGQSFVLSQVDQNVERVSISIRGTIASLDNPIIDIQGLGDLPELKDIRIYHAPQVDSFDFLADLPGLERLVISFARVRSIAFLSSLSSLRVLVLEFCDDWEIGAGLPFLDEPLDLGPNPKIEYIGFRVCGLDRMPQFLSVPDSLAYLDLSYNSIRLSGEAPASLRTLRDVKTIFLEGNPTDPTATVALPNIVFGSADDVLGRYLK